MATQPSSISRYEEVLARAIAALPSDARERHRTYDRARTALVERLRSATPPLPGAAIESEQAALEAAIQRVERQFGGFADENFEPPPPAAIVLRTPRRGALIALVCCAAIILALLVGFFGYQNRREILKSAYQGVRPAAVQSNERASQPRSAAAPSSAAIPYVYMRQLVHYRSTNPAGTVIIDKAQRHLYVILANVTAVRYGIAVGGSCVETAGRYIVSRKLEPSTSQTAPAVARSTDGRALYLDSDTRLIHGTEASSSIGQSVGAGCFQLIQADLAELYGRVPVGTRVLVN